MMNEKEAFSRNAIIELSESMSSKINIATIIITQYVLKTICYCDISNKYYFYKNTCMSDMNSWTGV